MVWLGRVKWSEVEPWYNQVYVESSRVKWSEVEPWYSQVYVESSRVK